MFSIPDILVVSILALLLFGPERLPKVMRQAGRFVREVQSTSQSFIAEMERAAEISESAKSTDDAKDRSDWEPDVMSRKVSPTNEATERESDGAEQTEPSPGASAP